MAVLLTRPVKELVSNANPQTLQTSITTALNTIKTAALAQNIDGQQQAGQIDRNSIEVSDITVIYNSTDVALYYVTVSYNVLY